MKWKGPWEIVAVHMGYHTCSNLNANGRFSSFFVARAYSEAVKVQLTSFLGFNYSLKIILATLIIFRNIGKPLWYLLFSIFIDFSSKYLWN